MRVHLAYGRAGTSVAVPDDAAVRGASRRTGAGRRGIGGHRRLDATRRRDRPLADLVRHVPRSPSSFPTSPDPCPTAPCCRPCSPSWRRPAARTVDDLLCATAPTARRPPPRWRSCRGRASSARYTIVDHDATSDADLRVGDVDGELSFSSASTSRPTCGSSRDSSSPTSSPASAGGRRRCARVSPRPDHPRGASSRRIADAAGDVRHARRNPVHDFVRAAAARRRRSCRRRAHQPRAGALRRSSPARCPGRTTRPVPSAGVRGSQPWTRRSTSWFRPTGVTRSTATLPGRQGHGRQRTGSCARRGSSSWRRPARTGCRRAAHSRSCWPAPPQRRSSPAREGGPSSTAGRPRCWDGCWPGARSISTATAWTPRRLRTRSACPAPDLDDAVPERWTVSVGGHAGRLARGAAHRGHGAPRAETIQPSISDSGVRIESPGGCPTEPLFEFAVPDACCRRRCPTSRTRRGRRPRSDAGHGRRQAPAADRHPASTATCRSSLLTAAAMVPGPSPTASASSASTSSPRFTCPTPPLGAVAFIAQVSQLLWAVPLAVLADRGSRKLVAAGRSSSSPASVPDGGAPRTSGGSPSCTWPPRSARGEQHVHNSYLSDAYPTEARGRIFSWHNLSDPLSQTVGILIFGLVVTVAHDWRYGLLVGAGRHPARLRPLHPARAREGANEASHILKASGMDLHSQQEQAPRVLLGPRSPVCCGSDRSTTSSSPWPSSASPARAPLCWGASSSTRNSGLDVGERSEVYAIIGLAVFLGLPLAYVFGDRYFRQIPQPPFRHLRNLHHRLRGAFVPSLYVPQLWLCVIAPVPFHRRPCPLAICIFLTLAATAPPEMRTICFAMFGVYSLVFGGFTGSVLLGAVSDAVGGLHEQYVTERGPTGQKKKKKKKKKKRIAVVSGYFWADCRPSDLLTAFGRARTSRPPRVGRPAILRQACSGSFLERKGAADQFRF